MKKKLFVCLLAAAMCFTLTGCGKNENDNNEQKDPFGTIEKVTVFDTIDKFNIELSNNNLNYFANNEYMIAENDIYWYGLYEDITCHVKPVEFTNDLKKDITYTTSVRYSVNSKHEQMALDYVKYLIKSNNSSLTDSEISDLMNKAKEQASDKKTAYNGKGITVGVFVTDDFIEYQVARIYK